MVQALGGLINEEYFEETFLDRVSSFSCSRNHELENFLKSQAVDFEKKNLARTFLVLDDDELANHNIKINGYFSLSIKSILFSDEVSKNTRNNLAKNKQVSHVGCFLLGQIAKDDEMPSGYGQDILKFAISKIRTAQENAACRFLYIDCAKSLKAYYQGQGFKYMQVNPDNENLIQMYIMI